MAFAERIEASARSTTGVLLAFAIGIAIVGGIVVAANWPTTDVGACNPLAGTCDTTDHGSAGLVLFGFALTGVGSIVILVPLVAYGVRLGIRLALGDYAALTVLSDGDGR